MQPLDPATLPLQGLRLIEASAGTGKTFTIAGLYLRVLLEREIGVDSILVVTFTRAATEELHARIRAALRDGIEAFRAGHANDPLLAALLSRIAPADGMRRLQDALLQMDTAAIHTIHGFCQRVLRDNAFESGEPFWIDFVPDAGGLTRQVVEDFWRRQFYERPRHLADLARSKWSSPAALLADIRPYLGRSDFSIALTHNGLGIDDFLRAFDAALSELRLQWRLKQADVEELLLTHPGLDRRVYGEANLRRWLGVLDAYLADPRYPFRIPETLPRLAAARLARATAPPHAPPQGPVFDLVGRVCELAQSAAGILRRDAIRDCRRHLARSKSDANVLSYEDLLERLDQALRHERGEALAQRLRRQYPIAMIDEFQDTDEVQYRIFEAVYGSTAAAAEPCGLILIGDPKQSIYSFRGADVYAYIKARRRTAETGGHYTLDTNHRSSRALVKALNGLFGRAAAPFVLGADIPFVPVAAAGRADATPLMIAGREAAPLHLWFLPRRADNRKTKRFADPATGAAGPVATAVRTAWALDAVAEQTAAEMRALLSPGYARIGDRALGPEDIAVLVRDRYEAGVIQETLRRAGLPSVFLSRDNVFHTDEASELARVLRAIADPGDERLVRAALATQLLGARAAEIDAVEQDDSRWEAHLSRFAEYRRYWQEYGFLAAFRFLMRDAEVGYRLLASTEGERRITNLRHLAELAAQAADENAGVEALTHWFCRQCAEDGRPDAGGEEQELRLQSDTDLIQVVTQHRSKGLQYPIVFVPFPWRCRVGDRPEHFVYHDEASGAACVELGSKNRSGHLRQHGRERLAEDVRLLYVALTRARYRCYLSWGLTETAPESALAHLLHPPRRAQTDRLAGGARGRASVPPVEMAGLGDGQIRDALASLAAATGAEVSDLMPRAGTALVRPSDSAREPAAVAGLSLAAAVPARRVAAAWCLTSFSALASGRGADAPPAATERDGEFDLDPGDADVDTPVAPPGGPEAEFQDAAGREADSIFTFPKGARAGTCLHAILEGLDFTDRSPAHLAAQVQTGLAQQGFEAKWQPVIEGMVRDLLGARLDATGDCRLEQILLRDRLVEMEFHFPAVGLAGAELEAVLARRRQGMRPPLATEYIRGFVKGFIDLTFRYRGRFFIADYKSNHLGNRPEDYQVSRLEEAVFGHYYDLQYLLYTLALHRYLGRRLPGYHYELHFGGVYYLFLRGMRAGLATGVFFDRPSLSDIAALDALFMQGPSGRSRPCS